MVPPACSQSSLHCLNFDDQEGRSPSILSTTRAGLSRSTLRASTPWPRPVPSRSSHGAAGTPTQTSWQDRTSKGTGGGPGTGGHRCPRPPPMVPGSEPARIRGGLVPRGDGSVRAMSRRTSTSETSSRRPAPSNVGFRLVGRHVGHGGLGHGRLLPGWERGRLDRGRRWYLTRRPSRTGLRSSAEFGSWYSTFSSTGKPMMVSSTGARLRIAAGLPRPDPVRSPESVSTGQGIDLLRCAGAIERQPVPTGRSGRRIVRAVGRLTRPSLPTGPEPARRRCRCRKRRSPPGPADVARCRGRDGQQWKRQLRRQRHTDQELCLHPDMRRQSAVRRQS